MAVESVAEAIRRNAKDPVVGAKPFVLMDDVRLTHREYAAECARMAHLLLDRRAPDQPFHLAVLLDNVPEYLVALGACALSGATLVGINNVQRGENLLRDIRHTDCQLLLTEPRYAELLDPLRDRLEIPRERVFVTHRYTDGSRADRLGVDLDEALAELTAKIGTQAERDPDLPIDPHARYILVFTSGTTGAPKAVQISQARMVSTGERIGGLMEVGPGDVGYLAMPLFHANSQQCGFMPALLQGGAIAMIPKFSRSRWLDDVRRYGVTYFNYTGKPLSYILTTPRRPDDASNPLRVSYGNEGSARIVAEFSERFGCSVIDGFGATEGGFGFSRTAEDPVGSVGKPPEEIRVLDESGKERPRGKLDAQGRLTNPDEAIGEIVNTSGPGKFEGYYKNPDATAERIRGGMYWSGDFGFKDEQGYLYFTGRDISWIRVDGENFIAKPIEDVLQRHPDVYLCAVYGVPDVEAGDRVMATVVLGEDARFDPEAFLRFLESQADVSPKWIPTYIRVATSVPQTATNKILKRELVQQRFDPARVSDPIFWRERGDTSYKPFTREDFQRVSDAFERAGRSSFLAL